MIGRVILGLFVLLVALVPQGDAAFDVSALHGVFTPKQFGAKGDGSTDDRVALQAMCAAVQAAGGGTIQFERNKTYVVYKSTTISASTALCNFTGSTGGVTIDFNGSTIQVDALFTHNGVSVLALIGTNTTGSNFTFKGLKYRQTTPVTLPAATGNDIVGTIGVYVTNGGSLFVLDNPQGTGGLALADFAGDPNSIAGNSQLVTITNFSSTDQIYGVVTPGGAAHAQISGVCVHVERCGYTYGTSDQSWKISSQNPIANDFLIAAGGANFTATGTANNASPTITGVSSTANVVDGTGLIDSAGRFPFGAIILSHTVNSITMNANATGTTVGDALTFGIRPTSGIKVAYRHPARTAYTSNQSLLTFQPAGPAGTLKGGIIDQVEAVLDFDYSGESGVTYAVYTLKNTTAALSSLIQGVHISGSVRNIPTALGGSTLINWNELADAPWTGERQYDIEFNDLIMVGPGSASFRADLNPFVQFIVGNAPPMVFRNFNINGTRSFVGDDILKRIDSPGVIVNGTPQGLFATNPSGYTQILDETQQPAILLGSIADNQNFYQQTTHNFRTRAGVTQASLSTSGLILAYPLQLPKLTFATIPIACGAGTEGLMYAVTDSTVVTFNAVIAGGGANHVIAYCNGTQYVAR